MKVDRLDIHYEMHQKYGILYIVLNFSRPPLCSGKQYMTLSLPGDSPLLRETGQITFSFTIYSCHTISEVIQNLTFLLPNFVLYICKILCMATA